MITFYKKWQHQQMLKKITPIFQEKKYILGDFFHDNYWCVALFIGYNLIFLRKKMHNQHSDGIIHHLSEKFHSSIPQTNFDIIILNKQELLNHKIWNHHAYHLFLKSLEKRIHQNNKKDIFLINSTEHILEDVGNFIHNRSFQTQITCVESFSLLQCLLSNKYSNLYSPRQDRIFQGTTFD